MIRPLAGARRDFLLDGGEAAITIAREDARPRSLGEAAIAIGVFDGVHIGHRDLIGSMVRAARERGRAAVALTFDPDPDRVLSKRPAPQLMGTRDRLRALSALGVDRVLVVPFTAALAAMGYARFLETVLLAWADVRSIHVGADFRLGADGAGTVGRMGAWCAPRGIEVSGRPLVRAAGAPVTASRIRRLIGRGDVAAATELLGRRYLVRGRVSPGRGAGRGMGFPTANIELDAAAQAVGDGVYAGLALADGRVWPCAINAGVPPMFRDDARAAALEATLLGYEGDLYGRDIAVTFVERLRASRRFATTDELIAQVHRDIDHVRATLGEGGVSLGDDQR